MDNIPGNILSFLNEVPPVAYGYNQIRFLNEATFADSQTGYSVGKDGKSLVTGKEGAWEEGWVVIGNDRLDDPVFIDISDEHSPVMIAAEGEDSWDPIFIADSLDTFRQLIEALQPLSAGRSDPASLKSNPLPGPERQQFLKTVAAQNPGSDIWYWEDFLED